jgi:hypothetical protein
LLDGDEVDFRHRAERPYHWYEPEPSAGDLDGRSHGPPSGEFIDRFVFPSGEYRTFRASCMRLPVPDRKLWIGRTFARITRQLCCAGSTGWRRSAAIAAGGAERYRVWRMYMVGMAYAFERGWLSVGQVVAIKSLPDGLAPRPRTRTNIRRKPRQNPNGRRPAFSLNDSAEVFRSLGKASLV